MDPTFTPATLKSSVDLTFENNSASPPNLNLQPPSFFPSVPPYPPYYVQPPCMFTGSHPVLIESPYPLPFVASPTFMPPSPVAPIYPPTPSPLPIYPPPRASSPPSHEPNPPYLQAFWGKQIADLARQKDFKTLSLPLSRIRKLMKSVKAVKMVSSDVLAVLAQATELFILETTVRSWNHTETRSRCTLQRSDLAVAISKNKVFDFLVNIVPKEEVAPPVAEEMNAAPATYQPEVTPQFQIEDPEYDFTAMLQDTVDVAAWQQLLAEMDANSEFGGSSAEEQWWWFA